MITRLIDRRGRSVEGLGARHGTGKRKHWRVQPQVEDLEARTLLSGQATVPNPQPLLVFGVSGTPTSLVPQTAVGTGAALAATSSNSDQSIPLSVKPVPIALQVNGR